MLDELDCARAEVQRMRDEMQRARAEAPAAHALVVAARPPTQSSNLPDRVRSEAVQRLFARRANSPNSRLDGTYSTSAPEHRLSRVLSTAKRPYRGTLMYSAPRGCKSGAERHV